nr:hypothetical protein [Tanacetum cinerariifolium]
FVMTRPVEAFIETDIQAVDLLQSDYFAPTTGLPRFRSADLPSRSGVQHREDHPVHRSGENAGRTQSGRRPDAAAELGGHRADTQQCTNTR